VGHRYVPDVPTSGGRSWKSWFVAPRRRRTCYAVGVGWLCLAGLAAAQWLSANASRGRWLAGMQCVPAIALAISYLAQARRKDGGEGSG
jgi:hypothetical protein